MLVFSAGRETIWWKYIMKDENKRFPKEEYELY